MSLKKRIQSEGGFARSSIADIKGKGKKINKNTCRLLRLVEAPVERTEVLRLIPIGNV